MSEIAVWVDERGMLWTEHELKKGLCVPVCSGTVKNRYQLVKYLKGYNLYEEWKARRDKRIYW